MEHIFFCPKCGATYGLNSPNEIKDCADCNIRTVYTGHTDETWSLLSPEDKRNIKETQGSKAIYQPGRNMAAGVSTVNNRSNSSYASSSNTTASIIKVFGIISIVAGFIVGIVLGNAYSILDIGKYYTHASFNWGIFLGVFFSFTFIGLLLIGIAEIIRLLTSIDNKR